MLLATLSLALCTLVLCTSGGARAQTGAAGDGGSGLTPDLSAIADQAPAMPEVLAQRRRSADIRALQAGKLDVAIEAASLFGVSLDDERAIAVELRRLRAIIAATDAEAAGGGGGDVASGGSGGGGDGYWQARIELDRATQEFLSLSRQRRTALRDKHVERRRAGGAGARDAQEARRKTEQIEQDRLRALWAAKQAPTEAERRIELERARLLEIKAQRESLRGKLEIRAKATSERAKELVEWDGLVDKATAQTDPSEIDALYDKLHGQLATSRRELDAAVRRWSSVESLLAPAGASSVDLGADNADIDAIRDELRRDAAALLPLASAASRQHTRVLVREVEGLSRLRLELIPKVSQSKRDELHSFGQTGQKQARAELAQVVSIIRYHFTASQRWLQEFDLDKSDPDSRMALYFKALELLAAVIVFVWWYRRADRLFVEWREREQETDKPRLGLMKLVHFIRQIRRPAELLSLFFVLRWLLPAEQRDLIEVRLVGVVLWWILGESLVVDAIDALAGQSRRDQHHTDSAKLRLRSLKLIGRVVVVFGVTLSLSSMLVGEGTVYQWVLRACWFTAIPLVLVLVHWWKPLVFERVGSRRKHTAFTGWVTENRKGTLSPLAALLGGIYLFSRGGLRLSRSYVGRFDLTRRALAYWFRRELTRKQDNDEEAIERPLDERRFELLAPARAPDELVASVADPQTDEVIRCIDAPGGGVFAVIGERGGGKSSLLRRIEKQSNALLVRCPHGGIDAFLAELMRALELPEDADLAALSESLSARSTDSAIMVDDAHRLVRPVIGGLEDFDRLLAVARSSSVASCTWVFALDSVIWQFFLRARGARPIFDDVIDLQRWSEENIASLLQSRSRSAAIEPCFDRMLTEMREEQDEVELSEARSRAETNYYRLLWDYADGNPAVALHFWRASLLTDEDERDMVRLFRPPDTTDIEQLPDDAVFVLRAVLQLDAATIEDIVKATMLSSGPVQDALRYALARGYLERDGDRYRLTWHWFRAITLVLERRHLLIGRS
jgi:hypothetical protein